ncbi:MAG: L,D-transpeptidase, partial [Gemmatimonadetes bacterium]|nr:L,D-transpeptidase [Gemmatimonadota bacterium]
MRGCTRRLDTALLVAAVVALALNFALVPPAAQASPADPAAGPTPPTGVEVFDRQEDLGIRVTLSWSHRPECAGYHVYRAAKPDGAYELVGGVSADTMEEFPFFLDDGVTGGETYYYRVAALDGSWREGPMSEPVSAEPPSYRRSSGVGKYMVCSIGDQRVYFFENDVIVNILRCSTGAGGTPTGNYRILAHRGTVSGCPFWMDWKPNYGMHSWPSYLGGYEENLGVYPRSHGCIRLHPLEASWAYYWAPDGTPLTITYASLGRLPLQGASCSAGATKPSRTWYFAEGYTGGEFLEYLLLFNPGATEVNAKTTYYPENAPPVTEVYNVPAGTRRTVFVNGVTGL